MLKTGAIIEFDRKKYFKYIRPLGSGGTGDTHLFKDETTDMLFAIKKYSPKDLNHIEDNYRRFVDEIKILFKLSYTNVVRVYNYYLYPDLMLGYLQMEYIEGKPIDEFEPDGWGKDWNDIFTEVVSAFEYLEHNNILHRDIRPANILIDKDENVKIIDFGFGKQIKNPSENSNSVLLNWPVTEFPQEILFNKEYNHQTEIYFVGKLFEHLIENSLNDFKFIHTVEKMVKTNPKQRYKNFGEVSKSISAGVLGEINFSEEEKNIYRNFANELSNHINYYIDTYKPINDFNWTITKLAELIHDSALEEYIQDNSSLIKCFIIGGYSYNGTKDIKLKCIVDFYQLLINLDYSRQKIMFDNIYNRLSKIRIEFSEDEIPF